MRSWEIYLYADTDLDKKSNKEYMKKISIELKDKDIDNVCIDKIIKTLIEKNKKWENFYCCICGKKLYSCDIKTIDDAYLILYWKTKTEKERKDREEREEREKLQKRELELINNIPKWIKEWKKYIDRDKRSEWEEYVNFSARNFYYWSNIEIIVKILKMLDENKNINEIQHEFNKQECVWITRSIIKTYITYFSKKWKEFWDNIY